MRGRGSRAASRPSHAPRSESARATTSRAWRTAARLSGSIDSVSTAPPRLSRLNDGIWMRSAQASTSRQSAPASGSGLSSAPDVWRSVPKRTPVTLRRRTMTFFCSSGSSRTSARISPASKRLRVGDSGFATSRPVRRTLPCVGRTSAERTSTRAPVSDAPTDSTLRSTTVSAKSHHAPAASTTTMPKTASPGGRSTFDFLAAVTGRAGRAGRRRRGGTPSARGTPLRPCSARRWWRGIAPRPTA